MVSISNYFAMRSVGEKYWSENRGSMQPLT
jgi:hypothetical protein